MAIDFQPYVGPRPYKRNDLSPFFGRNREADELVSLIISSWEVLFYAQSGTGKTSLLNARIFPLLEEEGFEVLPLARVQGVIPKGIQSEAIQNLYVFNTLMSWERNEVNPQRFVKMSLTEYLKERKHRTGNDGEPLPRALIFDQFEEIFTLYQDRWHDRNDFFKQVRDALKAENRFLRVIFAIREDYIAQLDPYAHLLPEKLRNRFRIERLRVDAALSAVTGPLKETHRSFAKGVAERLVEDLLKTRVETITGETIEVIGEFVEPVQLQVVCQNLWQELQPDVIEITEQHVSALGGVDRPLSRFYESAVKEAVGEAGIKENELRQWCEKWLITSNGTRNIVHRGTPYTEELPTIALDSLVAHHLLNLELRAGSYWYELTHDGFIEPIRASNERWNKHREEKADKASFLIRQAEQNITMEKYEKALDSSKNAYALSEEIGDLHGEGLALFYVGKAYEGKKQYDKALTTYSKALELVKQTDARDLESNLLETQRILSASDSLRDEQLKQSLTGDIALLPNDLLGYYNRGLANYNLKQYEQALEDYDHALELDPKYVDAYNNRGLAYYGLKEYERAIEDYTHALELDPKYAVAYYNRGLAYLIIEEYEQAIADNTHALELDPKYVKAYYNRGLAYYNLKQYEQAIEDYTHALELDSTYVDAYNNRGLAYLIIEEYEQAIEDYNRALELDPKYVNAYYNLGLAYSNLKEYERAIENYTHVLELDSKDSDAYNNRGNAYSSLKQYEQALEDYNRVLVLDPKYVDAYNNRGSVYYNLKQYEQALADFNHTLELDPKYVDAYYGRGNAYYSLKHYEQALVEFGRAIEIDPKYSNAYYMRGITYIWMRDIKQAQIEFNHSWQLDSTNVNYGWVIEWATMCQEKPGLAMADRLEAMAANDPNYFVAYVCRGVALWIRESFEKAEAELNQAISLNPEFEDSYFWKGVVLVYLGQDDDALAAIEKSLELGLQPILLTPLRWLEQDRPDFYHKYAAPLLARFEI